jgi:hypothetical protein
LHPTPTAAAGSSAFGLTGVALSGGAQPGGPPGAPPLLSISRPLSGRDHAGLARQGQGAGYAAAAAGLVQAGPGGGALVGSAGRAPGKGGGYAGGAAAARGAAHRRTAGRL